MTYFVSLGTTETYFAYAEKDKLTHWYSTPHKAAACEAVSDYVHNAATTLMIKGFSEVDLDSVKAALVEFRGNEEEHLYLRAPCADPSPSAAYGTYGTRYISATIQVLKPLPAKK